VLYFLLLLSNNVSLLRSVAETMHGALQTMPYSARLAKALDYAVGLFGEQKRKVGGAPVISHLLMVAALVSEAGGDEDQIIAALLHDAAEDAGGERTLQQIREQFGDRVAMIVDWCSDTLEFPKPPWETRKRAHVQRLYQAPSEALLVVLADKLHNARSILAALRRIGPEVFSFFSGGRDGTLWYYREMVRLFRKQLPDCDLTGELTRTVEEIHRRLENPPLPVSYEQPGQ
jgi:(p)ppGpp synthase/HD superfamily hydrolase